MKRKYQLVHDDAATCLIGGEQHWFPLGEVFVTLEAGESDAELKAAWGIINLLAQRFSMKLVSEGKE